jgi:hypothetical protein
MLECDFCGCTSEKPGKGWVAYRMDDRIELAELFIAVYCPPCAASEFGHRPGLAATYDCAFEDVPRAPGGADRP